MLVKEFEGQSEEEAIENALKALNLDRSKIKKVEQLESGSSFFGLRKKNVKIKVFYEDEGDQITFLVKKHIDELFKILNIAYKILSIKEENNQILITLSSKDSDFIIGKYGTNLEAIQLWLNTVIFYCVGLKDYKKVILDIEKYWAKKTENIKKLAQEAVNYVRESKKSKLLPEMNSFERRLVHLTLQNMNDVVTKSEGSWPSKRVRIFLKRDK